MMERQKQQQFDPRNFMYRDQLLTKGDLIQFRAALLNDLTEILNTQPAKQMQWLKSSEVRRLLKISAGTLQNLRINGTLKFTKIGGIVYYQNSDLEKLLASGIKSGQQHKNQPIL